MNIRVMTIEDYEKVYGLWRTIRGFGIRSMDDSREGISRFLKAGLSVSCLCAEGLSEAGRGQSHGDCLHGSAEGRRNQ